MFIRNSLRIAKNHIKLGGGKVKFRIVLGVIASLSFVLFSFWFFNKVFYHLSNLEQFPLFFIYGLTTKFFSMIFITVFSMIILSSLVTSISTFFSSQELQLLYSLPINKWRIYFKKAFETLIYSSYLLVLIVIPALLAYAKNFSLDYYLISIGIGTFLIFVIGPCLIGVSLTIILVAYLPIKRVHQFLAGIFGIVFVTIIFLFRMMNPEKLINPVSTMDFVAILNRINEPLSVYYPHYWISAAIVGIANKNWDDVIKYNFLIIGMAIVGIIILSLALKYIYPRSWNRSQSVLHNRIKSYFLLNVISKIKILDNASRALLAKELILFSRDSSQWSQMLLLVALIVIYVYNITNIEVPISSARIIVSYINIALSGFVLTALGMRFVFPSISLEGQAVWIIFSSPIEMKKYLRIKKLIYFLLLFITSQLIIWISNFFLGVSLKVMLITSMMNIEFVLVIIGIGLGLGMIYRDFTIDNSIKLASTFGGIMFMILSFAAVCIIILIEAYPVYMSFKKFFGFEAAVQYEWAFHLGSFIFSLLCYYLFLRIGIKSFESIMR